jgi:hypothetical protein
MEPGYNDNMIVIGYYHSLETLVHTLVRNKMVDKKGTFSFKEYIAEHKQTIKNFKQALDI